MKTLPTNPYMQNIVRHWHDLGNKHDSDEYIEYLKQFGFIVPVDIMKNQLEFPDSFGDKELLQFVLRWS